MTLPAGEIVALLEGHTEAVLALDFSADGRFLASGGVDDQAIIWDVGAKSAKLRLTGHQGDVNAVRFSRDGKRLVTGSDDATLVMWRTQDGTSLAHMKQHRGIVYDAVFSPDGMLLASASGDRTVQMWDAETGQHRLALPAAAAPVMSLSFSPDGKTLIGGTGGPPYEIPAWAVASGALRTAYGGHDNLVLPAIILPDGQQAATAGGNGNEIDVWELQTGKQNSRLRGLGRAVFSTKFSADGRFILWGQKQSRLEINNWGEPEFQLRLPARVRPMGAPRPRTPDGIALRGPIDATSTLRLRAAASPSSRYFDVLDVLQGETPRARIRRTESDGYAHNSYTFSADERSIITGGGSGWLRRYDTNGRFLGDYAGHTGDVWSVATSADNRLVISGSDDQTVRLWNLTSHENIVSLFHASDGQWVMWTPQGYFDASPDGDDLIGWHVNRGADKAASFFTAAQLKRHFYRPDIIANAIRLASADGAVSRADKTEFSFDALTSRSPPAFKVLAIEPQIVDEAMTLKLALSFAPSNDPPQRLNIVVNGSNSHVSTKGLPGTGGGEATIEAVGASGRNLIEINVQNAVGTTTRRLAVDAPKIAGTTRKRLIVLAIGVNDYQTLDQDLSFAAADANAIFNGVKTFAGNLHQRIIGKLLADGAREAPTAANIREALKLLQKAEPEDTVIVFLAGHGINQGDDYLFLPRDARLEGERWRPETVVDWRNLQTTLETVKGRRIMVIDTCHAGNAFNPRLIKDADDANITVLAATDAETLAEERASLGHGVFTHAILRGLRGEADTGADGAIHARELGSFVEKTVSKITEGKQQPVAHLPVSGDFVFSKY